MPVNVDTVYQTVQALANKEQRGYLTPQEFNLFAIQAQKDIFEQYLYDLDAIRAENPEKRELGDSIRHVLFKIQNTDGVTINSDTPVTNLGTTIPPNLHTGRIFVTINTRKRTVTKIFPVKPSPAKFVPPGTFVLALTVTPVVLESLNSI